MLRVPYQACRCAQLLWLPMFVPAKARGLRATAYHVMLRFLSAEIRHALGNASEPAKEGRHAHGPRTRRSAGCIRLVRT